MYTILVNESNELITTVKERIMQRSKLVDKLHFLVAPQYKGIDMSTFTVTLEYLTPVSREYRTEILVRSDELYKGMLEFTLPFDTKLTREAGDVQLQLTFTRLILDANGKDVQQVRKTSPTTVKILPIAAWSDIIPDDALTALDQRIIMTQAMIEAASELNGGSCAGVYVPSYSSEGIMKFTLEEQAKEPVYEFDINPLNDWNEIDSQKKESTDYLWEEL